MKYPKVMWVPFVVGQKPINYPRRAFDEDPNDEHPTSTYKIKRYCLHPGNEVRKERSVLTKALNLIIRKPNYASVAWVNHVLEKLNGAGFPVRWDAKAGKFKESK